MRSQPSIVLVVLSFALAGCGRSGPQLSRVSGTVKLDGQPLPEATITFIPESGRPSYGVSDGEGRYDLVYTDDLRGALPGSHLVRVSTHRTADSESGTKAAPERIPIQYNAKSQLRKTVEPGANEIHLELVSTAGKVVQPAN